MSISKFTIKKFEVECLERMYRVLEQEKEDVCQTWGELEEMEQDTRWNRETNSKELVYNDDGTPKMVHKRGMIDKPADEYTEYDRAKLKAIENLMKKLEGMM